MQISVAVSNETYHEWANALATATAQQTIHLTTVGSLPPGGPVIPVSMAFSGTDFLVSVGRAAARIVPNGYDPSQYFALLKYASYLRPGTTTLQLAHFVGALDSHKKKVLSDEFGCGATYQFALQVLHAPHLLDFNTASFLHLISTVAPTSRQPDFVAVDPAQPTQLFVLEAKGTQTSLAYARDTQIPSGCNQLTQASIVRPGYSVGGRYATAIAIGRSGHTMGQTEIFVGDPQEGDNPDVYEFRTDPIESLLRSHYLRVAWFVGDESLATFLTTGEIRGRRQQRPHRKTPQGRSASGAMLEARSENGALLRMFVGLDEEVRERLLGREYEHIQSIDRREPIRRGELTRDDGAPVGEFSELSPDGVLFDVELVA